MESSITGRVNGTRGICAKCIKNLLKMVINIYKKSFFLRRIEYVFLHRLYIFQLCLILTLLKPVFPNNY